MANKKRAIALSLLAMAAVLVVSGHDRLQLERRRGSRKGFGGVEGQPTQPRKGEEQD